MNECEIVKKKYEILENILMEIFKCGDLDILKLIEIYKMAENLRVREILNLEFYDGDATDLNELLYIIMNKIINDLSDDLTKKERKKLLEHFNPYENYFDSYFNIDPLDNYNGESREEIVKELKKYIKEELK